MAVSQEEERYKQFESLIERFKVATPSLAGPKTAPPAHKERTRLSSTHKKRDPRSNAPPLIPLVEEGDQTQQDLYANCYPVDERLQKLAVSIATVKLAILYYCI